MSGGASLLGWTVCANISDHLRGGRETGRFYQGTRKFSAGTKVYLGQPYRGMGSTNLSVVGLHRIDRSWCASSIATELLINIRPAPLYSPRLWRTLTDHGAQQFNTKLEALQQAEELRDAATRERPEKLRPLKKEGPWGPALSEQYRTADPAKDNLVSHAAQFARDAHKSQMRKGAPPVPFISHLMQVVEIVRDRTTDKAVIAAAWLHDTIEATDTDFAELEQAFGARIAALVQEVSDDRSLTIDQRAQEQANRARSYSNSAALVKAAEKIANLRAMQKSPPSWTRAQMDVYLMNSKIVMRRLRIAPAVFTIFEEEAEAVTRLYQTRPPPLPR